MILAPAVSTPSPQPAPAPVIGRYIDTEVAGLYHAELHAGPKVGEESYASLDDAIAAATTLTTGDDAPGVAIVGSRTGSVSLRSLDWQWVDDNTKVASGPVEPAVFEGMEDVVLERTRAGASLLAIVDGESAFTVRRS